MLAASLNHWMLIIGLGLFVGFNFSGKNFFVVKVAMPIYSEGSFSICPQELGSGSSIKTKTLIQSILDQKGKLLYIPIDISETMLRDSAQLLLEEFPALKVVGVAAEYTQGLHILASEYSQRTKLVLWLGSSIGKSLLELLPFSSNFS